MRTHRALSGLLLVLACFALMGIVLIRASPRPFIDVWYFQQGAADALGIETGVLHIDDDKIESGGFQDFGDPASSEFHDHVPRRHATLTQNALKPVLFHM